MKKCIIVLIFTLILVFLICITSFKFMQTTQEQEQESFTPYINSYYRSFVRRTRRQLEGYPFPNLNRFYKNWGLL